MDDASDAGQRLASTEAKRGRETFRYWPLPSSSFEFNDSGRVIPRTKLVAAEDTTLTALAQLGACQTGVARSMISLFDQSYQYIIAEATPTLPLVPSIANRDGHKELWLCGTAIPRNHALCELALCHEGVTDPEHPKDLPLLQSHDVTTDARFASRLSHLNGCPARFYAAVPIRTSRGINIGVYCVLHNELNDAWTDQHAEILRNISRTIMRHLEGRRASLLHRRNERMNRGLGSFVEEKSAISRSETEMIYPSQDTIDYSQDASNKSQQNVSELLEPRPKRPAWPSHQTSSLPVPMDLEYGDDNRSRQQAIDSIFSRAASIISEAIEVESCMFVDAAKSTFGSLRSPKTDHDPEQLSTSTEGSSDDEKHQPRLPGDRPCCRVIGLSVSKSSKIGLGEDISKPNPPQEKLLSNLLRRYPKGKVFNFDANGELESSESGEDVIKGHQESRIKSQGGESKSRKSDMRPWSKQQEGASILYLFPKARSVAFVPVWDPRRSRWYAGCFVWTRTPTRTFSTEGELSYLTAFGTLAMAEAMRYDFILDERAKSDALSSLSHELRSPLHGVILGVELLNDTILNVTQGDIVHTIETCGRTLMDTLDNLLDFSKINNFITTRKTQRRVVRGASSDRIRTVQAGMMRLYSTVRLDRLLEEVVDSVFAGFNFQHQSISQLSSKRDGFDADVASLRAMDKMRAEEDLIQDPTTPKEMSFNFRNVSICISIEPNCSWIFETQAGAIRRMVMNLFGNALKYTRSGVIKIILEQEPPTPSYHRAEQLVRITVSDTGVGMTEDFLQNGLFKPFSQESNLSPGTGLGLSLVKRTASSLNGKVYVQSQSGKGTAVTVKLPLVRPSNGDQDSMVVDNDDFAQNASQLRGLRIRLLGLDGDVEHDYESCGIESHHPDYIGVRNTCEKWLMMEVISAAQADAFRPDLILTTEAGLAEREKSAGLNKPPCVVVCPNALVAYKCSKTQQSGIVQFISQPIGPRKLAKMLLLVFDRWTELQAKSPDPDIGLIEARKFFSSPQNSPNLFTSKKLKTETRSQLETNQLHISRNPERSQPDPIRPVITRENSNFKDGSAYLLVDDNSINLKILSTYMNKLGLPHQTATNGQEAINMYTAYPSRCKLIFMDVSMPVVNGFEASRRIRAFEHDHGIEPAIIIALTGLASTDAQSEAFGSGMDLFLTKPVRLKEITHVLRSHGFLGE